MKILTQSSRSSLSPFRRRHPTSEEIVEEVYRRVQEQQQMQQHQKPRPDSDKTVATVSRPAPTAGIQNGMKRSSVERLSSSRESRTDSKVRERAICSTHKDSRQKMRSITPFGRRRNGIEKEKSTSFDVTQLVAEYTSHNPGRVVSNSGTPKERSTTFLSIDEVDNQTTNPKTSRQLPKENKSSWGSMRRKKSMDSSDTTVHHRNVCRQQQSTGGESTGNSIVNMTNLPKTTDQNPVRSPKTVKFETSRQARSMSPFFRRRNKAASELIEDAKRNAIEIARVNEQPTPSMLGDRSLSGIVRSGTNYEQPSKMSPMITPPRRGRSLSPFARRKCVEELILDVHRKMEINYSDSTTGTSNDEDGVEIVLTAVADPVSPNAGFRRKRVALTSPTAVNVFCNGSPVKQPNDEDKTGRGLQTIATVLYEAPRQNNALKESKAVKRPGKPIRGRKSILISKNDKPELTKVSPTKSSTTVALNVSDTTNSTDLNTSASQKATKRKRRGLMSNLKSSGVVDRTGKKNGLQRKEVQSPAPKLRLDLVPPSSIAVGARSRVSELSIPNASKASTTGIPFTSRVKTRSLGERSLAEIQTALEKVQKELSGATKTGQTIPHNLVMEKLLAVADTIEAPDDRDKFLRKLSRLGSSTVSRYSDGGATTSEESDSSDDDDDDDNTSTDHLDTSGEESSFARWTAKHEKKKEPSLGQWTRLLDALGLNGLWDDDIDIEDLDLSRESVEENDDDYQSDDETTDRIPTPTPPIVQKMSFTGFIGQIASIGSFREDTNVEKSMVDDRKERERQAFVNAEDQRRLAIEEQERQVKVNQDAKTRAATQELERQAKAKEETRMRIAIYEEERMLRELEEMDKNIQTERQKKRKSQASERLKKLAADLQKENERLDRSKAVKFDAIDDEIPEDVIEMYVQEFSAERKKAIATEQSLRRAIEEEIMKQNVVENVLNKVQQEQFSQTKRGSTATADVINGEASKRSTTHSIASKPDNESAIVDSFSANSAKERLVDSRAQSSQHGQVGRFHTYGRKSLGGSAKSRETAANVVKRNLSGSVAQPVHRAQISMSETGTSLGSASLISQPQMTLSAITSRTGYTFANSTSQTHQSDSCIDGLSQANNSSILGSTKTDQFMSMSVMSDDQGTYDGNQSKICDVNSRITQPSVTSKSRHSWGTKQSQREPAVWSNSKYDSNFDEHDESYDDALSVGSIESHQFDAGYQSSIGTGPVADQTSRKV